MIKNSIYRKFSIISLLVLLIGTYLLVPVNKAHAFTPVVIGSNATKIVIGSQGEKVLLAVAEKAGVKFATNEARKKAVEKWNLELYEKYAKETAENKAAYESMLNRLNSAEVVPIPDKPGFGKIAFNTASMIIGLDLLYELTDMLSYAGQNGLYEDYLTDLDEALQSGEKILDLPGVTYLGRSPNPDHAESEIISFNYLNYLGQTAVLFSTGIVAGEPHTITYRKVTTEVIDGIETEQWLAELTRLVYLSYTSYPEIYTNQNYIHVSPVQEAVTQFIPTSAEVPALDVPTVLQPYKDNVVDPISDPVPTALPETTELIIPIGETPFPDATAEPINEPIPDSPGETGGEEPPTTEPPSENFDPTNPWKDMLPIAFLLALLDLLRAILDYLARMFAFILTIPLIPSIPIDNVAFAWFKGADIVGVKIYNIVSSMASIGLSFMVYRAIRRMLP